jgi:putative copper export protein
MNSFLLIQQSINSNAMADLVKILLGSTVWVGALLLFVWLRDKKKQQAISLEKIK